MSKPELMPWQSAGSTTDAPHPLLHLMLDELWEAASPEQAMAFFRAIGARLAREHPLEALESDNEILGSINALWAEWGWGNVGFDFGEAGLRILHADLPPAQKAGDTRWREIVSSVLAGAYEQWLSLLGGSPAAQLRIVSASDHEAEFYYGA